MYNYITIDDEEQRYFQYVGSFMAFYDYNTEETTKRFVLTLSQYGFEFLSQNGANAQSMKSVLDDFIDGNIGNITVTWGRFAPMNYYILDSGESLLADDYQDTPQYFDVISDLNNQFFNYENQYNTLKTQYLVLQGDYNTLYNRYNELSNEYTTLYQNYLLLETDYTNAIMEVETLQTEFNNYMVQFRLLEKTLSEKILENSRLESDLNNALIDVENLQITISQMETVISQLENIIAQLEENAEYNYQQGYTSAVEDLNFFESGIYTIFSAPFVLVGELAQIEIFGSSIVKIVGIILLFVILSFVLVFIWKLIPFA